MRKVNLIRDQGYNFDLELYEWCNITGGWVFRWNLWQKKIFARKFKRIQNDILKSFADMVAKLVVKQVINFSTLKEAFKKNKTNNFLITLRENKEFKKKYGT